MAKCSSVEIIDFHWLIGFDQTSVIVQFNVRSDQLLYLARKIHQNTSKYNEIHQNIRIDQNLYLNRRNKAFEKFLYRISNHKMTTLTFAIKYPFHLSNETTQQFSPQYLLFIPVCPPTFSFHSRKTTNSFALTS